MRITIPVEVVSQLLAASTSAFQQHDTAGHTVARSNTLESKRKQPKQNDVATTEMFTHKSLNHNQPSIRLVKVQPQLSPEGLIQCDM